MQKKNLGEEKDKLFIKLQKIGLIHNKQLIETSTDNISQRDKMDDYEKLEALVTSYLTIIKDYDIQDYVEKDLYSSQNDLNVHIEDFLERSSRFYPSIAELLLIYFPAFISFLSLVVWFSPKGLIV